MESVVIVGLSWSDKKHALFLLIFSFYSLNAKLDSRGWISSATLVSFSPYLCAFLFSPLSVGFFLSLMDFNFRYGKSLSLSATEIFAINHTLGSLNSSVLNLGPVLCSLKWVSYELWFWCFFQWAVWCLLFFCCVHYLQHCLEKIFWYNSSYSRGL